MIPSSRFVFTAALATALLSLTGCPKGGIPGVPGSGGASKVDPNTCGNYAASDTGRKLKAFLEASVQINDSVLETEKVVKQSCIIMGHELGMTDAELQGETKGVCDKVLGQIETNLKSSVKSKAALVVKYKPAVCKVDVDAAAHAAASCEGKAEADMKATCDGVCHGTCDGTCKGKAGSGGSSGQCDSECSGTCHGDCDGSANVDASATCRSQAEVKASVDVKCSDPELSIDLDAKLVIDPEVAKKTVAALVAGLPKLVSVKERLKPIGGAVEAWAKAAGGLATASSDLVRSMDDQARCIQGQLAGVGVMMPQVKASFSVSVEVSASASGSAGI